MHAPDVMQDVDPNVFLAPEIFLFLRKEGNPSRVFAPLGQIPPSLWPQTIVEARHYGLVTAWAKAYAKRFGGDPLALTVKLAKQRPLLGSWETLCHKLCQSDADKGSLGTHIQDMFRNVDQMTIFLQAHLFSSLIVYSCKNRKRPLRNPVPLGDDPMKTVELKRTYFRFHETGATKAWLSLMTSDVVLELAQTFNRKTRGAVAAELKQLGHDICGHYLDRHLEACKNNGPLKHVFVPGTVDEECAFTEAFGQLLPRHLEGEPFEKVSDALGIAKRIKHSWSSLGFRKQLAAAAR